MPNMLLKLDRDKDMSASRIQTYQDCPRKFFYNYVLAWDEAPDDTKSPEVSGSHHLVFGSAWHEALAYLLRNKPAVGYGMELAITAYQEHFLPTWREHFAPEQDEHFKKNPAKAMEMLLAYVEFYSHDDFEVLETEVAGNVALDDEITLNFRLDSICQDRNGKIFSQEHKTTGRWLNEQYWNGWLQKIQTGVYMHVLYCLYDEDDIKGVEINAACTSAKTPDKMLQRRPILRSMQQQEDWYQNVRRWIAEMQADIIHLDEYIKAAEEAELEGSDHHHDTVLEPFKKNTQHCDSYCSFIDFCLARSNPLRHSISPPDGFVERSGDPAEKEPKTVVNL